MAIVKGFKSHYNVPDEILSKYLMGDDEIEKIKMNGKKTTVSYQKGQEPEVEGYGNYVFYDEYYYVDGTGGVTIEANYYTLH